jgi:serine protease AprX
MKSTRWNALWGKGGRRAGAATLFTFCALAAATSAAAAPGILSSKSAFVQPSLASAALIAPDTSFDVIVEGDRKAGTRGFVKKALKGLAPTREFRAIAGVQVKLTGRQIQNLAKSKDVTAILANDSVKLTEAAPLLASNDQKWAWVTRAPVDWTQASLDLDLPTIAVVDSGIDAARADFGGRVLGQVDFTTTGSNSAGDGFGHGTFVAGIAAGSADGFAGVAPNANLLSLDVINDRGEATVADVVSACDWILANAAAYDIRVVNLSLQGGNRASVFFDPLDQAVERLWLSGITVVAASGNYGQDGAETEVSYAPGNDPFVITVGAADVLDTVSTDDDVAAPWSAWGYTADGFSKPELAAPGRYLIGPAPTNGGLAAERPDAIADEGYMQLSGTSFATPAVAGAAAVLLGLHPDWTPDQVKGALMVSAQSTPAAAGRSLGIGELDVAAARSTTSPPNPNAALNQFVGADADGAPIFDSAAWQSAAQADAAWGSAAWGSAAWGSAAWGSAAWGSAAWGSAAWGSAAWGSAAWGSAAWGSAAWGSGIRDLGLPASPMTAEQKDAVLVALGLE